MVKGPGENTALYSSSFSSVQTGKYWSVGANTLSYKLECSIVLTLQTPFDIC